MFMVCECFFFYHCGEVSLVERPDVKANTPKWKTRLDNCCKDEKNTEIHSTVSGCFNFEEIIQINLGLQKQRTSQPKFSFQPQSALDVLT